MSADVPAGGYKAALEQGAHGLRIGLVTGDFRDTLPADTMARLAAAAELFARIGAVVGAAIDSLAELLLAEAA